MDAMIAISQEPKPMSVYAALPAALLLCDRAGFVRQRSTDGWRSVVTARENTGVLR